MRLLVCLLLVSGAWAATPLDDQPPFGLEAASLKRAWQQSCKALARHPRDRVVKQGDPRFGTYGDWQALCAESAALPADRLVGYFNQNFTKVAMEKEGKFTAYYKPVLTGSRSKKADTQVPLLRYPAQFRRCEMVEPSPCPTRAQIWASLGQYEVLLWLDDPLDAYLLHIQGSGTVVLDDGQVVHVGFEGKNGHPYVPIGKVLRDWGELEGSITMPNIVAWVKNNPERRQELFENNPSYIFFRETAEEAPGALNVQLTAGRSVAVDRGVVPLGLPVLVRTMLSRDATPFNRIMMAQDVGSAIKGEARGDLYLGHGDVAAVYAGDQNEAGRMFYLLPKRLTGLAQK